MGVPGLWKLIEQSGKPVPLETLENKVLAIDISIWLHQVVKGFQDSSGAALPHAHLLGLFNRLCKLLFYRIKPVFVFDGGVPFLKQEVIRKRKQAKRNIHSEAERLQQLLLESLSREKIVQQALGETAAALLSPRKDRPARSLQTSRDDLYKLPPLKNPDGTDVTNESASSLDLTADSDSSFDEKNSRHYYNVNLQAIDVTSKHFQSLPADVRHDILTDIKDTRKESSWGRLHELPAQSDDFSEFQMKRLLKRRQVQVSLEDAEKEMGGKCLSLGEIEKLLKEDGVVDDEAGPSTSSGSKTDVGNRIASDENTRFLHVRDLKKAMKEEEEAQLLQASSPKKLKLDDDEEIMDEDLQRAIQMSLEECCEPTASTSGAVAADNSDDRIKLRPEQIRVLGNAAKTLAKAYMVEYGGLNSEDVNELMEMPDDDDVIECTFKYNDTSVLNGNVEDSDIVLPQPTKSITTEKSDDDVSSNADSDFIDVPELDSDTNVSMTLRDPIIFQTNVPPSPDTSKDFRHADLHMPVSEESRKFLMEVVINPAGAHDPKNDLFADVFVIDDDDDEEEIPKTKNTDVATTIDLVTPPKSTTHPKVGLPDVVTTSNKNSIATPKTVDPMDILNDLKKQMDGIDKITLDTLAPVIAEPPAVDDKPILVTPKKKSDLSDILNNLNKEICDLAQGNLNLDLVPAEVTSKLIKDDNAMEDPVIEIDDENEDSPVMKSSIKTKQSIISSFIDVTVTTPKKDVPSSSEKQQQDSPHTPKIPVPFFRKKTPSSKKKTPEHSPGSHSKVAKELFGETTTTPTEEKSEAMPPPAVPTASLPLSADDVVQVAASVLRDIKTTDELTEMASAAHKETRDLQLERNKQDRFGMSITERMNDDCKRLLRIFGIPYVVAPMEAEAQCAYFDAVNLTDGTITDDSDIWLFGGRTVYKHFFNQNKNVLEFQAETVERVFNVERSKFIQLAMLVGCDYTTGVNGIGAVTAMEILASFSTTPEKAGETSETMSMLSALRKFKEWLLHGRNIGPKTALRNKLKNITLTDDFPSSHVVNAFLHPEVNDGLDKFTWVPPDAETIREFAKTTFGWTYSRTDDTLMPVLRRLEEKKSQLSILNYFKCTAVTSNKEITVSKRVRQAINKMSKDGGNNDVDEEEPSKTKKPRKPRAKSDNADDDSGSAAKKPRATKKSTENGTKKAKRGKKVVNAATTVEGQSSEMPTSEVPSTLVLQPIVKIPKVPDFRPPIKQREKDKEDLEKNRLKAIELFNQSKTANANKKKK